MMWQTKICLTLAATGTALAVGLAPPALASLQTLTVVTGKVAVQPSGATSPEPWESGRMTAVATRLPDGRLRVSLSARMVATRSFTAQLAVQPCNASYNAVDLAENAADPLGHPLHPILFGSGYSPFKSFKVRKGASGNLRLAAVVSTDDRWSPTPHHWTDCVSVNLIDQAETDKAAISQDSYIPDHVGDFAFATKPLILSVTQPDDLSRHQ
jgi:hypothetical protein